ncbi:hypothetical protein QP585_24550 [Serratia ureilytica]|uniref:hypothetical protein n=1 Tax=Serratia ureilytica TaxID=300181 RepID=UPI00254E285B|nr:hypothetical protein [Serratia ureilytica]MDK7596281.1 hypothetical protein [Serratia ureilytica]
MRILSLIFLFSLTFPVDVTAGNSEAVIARSAAGLWGVGCGHGADYLKRVLNGGDRKESMAIELGILNKKIQSGILKSNDSDEKKREWMRGLAEKYSVDGFKSKVHDVSINCLESSRVVEIKILRSLLDDSSSQSELAGEYYYKYN